MMYGLKQETTLKMNIDTTAVNIQRVKLLLRPCNLKDNDANTVLLLFLYLFKTMQSRFWQSGLSMTSFYREFEKTNQ